MKAKNKANEQYLLATKVFCGHCGSVMVNEYDTSDTGQTYRYYECTCHRRSEMCNKKPEPKNALENFIVQYVIHDILTDDNIDFIATETYEAMKKESESNSDSSKLKAKLCDTERQLSNIIQAIEQGIITDSVMDKLHELEGQKEDLETKIDEGSLIKDIILTKEQIAYFLTSLKNGDIENADYKQKVIDTLVNSVYISDDPDGRKKITIKINISHNNSYTVKALSF